MLRTTGLMHGTARCVPKVRLPLRVRAREPVRSMSSGSFAEQGNPIMARLFVASLGLGVLAGICYYGSPGPDATEEERTKAGLWHNLTNGFARISNIFDAARPADPGVLLPPPYTGPDAKPYTLVIDLDQFLVHHVWDPQQGRWRHMKRPGVDLFLFYMAHMYEVVVYSAMNVNEGEMIMEKLDPYHFVSARLYDFALCSRDGARVKDLKVLGRDLSKVIVFGHDPSFSAWPDNFIQVAPWTGNPDDTLLESSIDFLEMLSFSGAKDVREVLRSFGDAPVLAEFERRQALVHEQARTTRQRVLESGWTRYLTRLFMPELSDPKVRDHELMTFEQRQAQIRAYRMRIYVEEKARIQAEYERQLEASKNYMAQNKMGLFDMMVQGPPAPPPELLAPPPSEDAQKQ